jgi:hypothetical protein
MTIEREARPIARVALWVGAIGLFVLAVGVVTRGIVGTLTNDLTAPGGAFWDFRDAGYFPVRAVLDSVVPYNVVEYFASYPVAQEFPLLPPTYILIHFPFILLSLPAASTAMFAVNLVAIVALSAWSVSLARYRVTPVAVLVVSGLMILSNGGRNVLNTGQITLLFVAGIYLALTARRDSLGSVGVFASLVKPAMGGPVVILLLASGRVRRALIGAGAAFVMSFVLMLPMVGWAGGLADLIDILMDNLSYSASSPWISLETTTARIDVTATIAMLLDVVPSRGTEIAIGFAVIGAAGYALNSRRTSSVDRHESRCGDRIDLPRDPDRPLPLVLRSRHPAPPDTGRHEAGLRGRRDPRSFEARPAGIAPVRGVQPVPIRARRRCLLGFAADGPGAEPGADWHRPRGRARPRNDRRDEVAETGVWSRCARRIWTTADDGRVIR